MKINNDDSVIDLNQQDVFSHTPLKPRESSTNEMYKMFRELCAIAWVASSRSVSVAPDVLVKKSYTTEWFHGGKS